MYSKTRHYLIEMTNLDKELTGLKVNLWIDSSGQKRDIKHSPYRIKMQNNYRRLIDSNDMIPISIDKENPENIDKIKLKIKTKDYNEVKQFIKDNYEDLCLLIQNKITDRELIHRLEDKLNKKNLEESEDLFEMANLPGTKTNLRTATIWSDGGGVFRKRKDKLPRIKVGIKDEFLVSLSLDDELKELYKARVIKKSEEKIINLAKEYIKRNLDLFIKHYNSSAYEYDDDDLKYDLAQRGYYKQK